MLADGVVHLDPAAAVFEAMLEGWARQQRTRFPNVDGTIKPRLMLLRRFAEFTGEYPRRWRAEDVEAFMDWHRARRREQGRGFAVSTGRNYQNGLRLFGGYVTDARYGRPARCVELFGEAPAQILHEWNTVTHSSDYEGSPGRRPLTYDEVQAQLPAAVLADLLDIHVTTAINWARQTKTDWTSYIAER
ncbi:hypothetical protein [Kribbella qitaiheensis]|uniref:hypothetical protein n=1 Tax=Kribbella qitaiheensis TaxID=1544730 RepID=UPI00162A5AB8|nr:hypothetical protein [Kribbella qitaiheensis]